MFYGHQGNLIGLIGSLDILMVYFLGLLGSCALSRYQCAPVILSLSPQAPVPRIPRQPSFNTTIGHQGHGYGFNRSSHSTNANYVF